MFTICGKRNVCELSEAYRARIEITIQVKMEVKGKRIGSIRTYLMTCDVVIYPICTCGEWRLEAQIDTAKTTSEDSGDKVEWLTQRHQFRWS